MSTAEFLFYAALVVAYTSVALGLAVLIAVGRQIRQHDHDREQSHDRPPLQQWLIFRKDRSRSTRERQQAAQRK
jgi:hypothetical protein